MLGAGLGWWGMLGAGPGLRGILGIGPGWHGMLGAGPGTMGLAIWRHTHPTRGPWRAKGGVRPSA